jgi:hypothetical protein
MIEERWTKSKISDIAKHLAIQESRNKDALVCRCTFHFGTSFRPATKDEIIKNTCKKAFTTPYRERGKVPAEAYHMGKWLGYTVELCFDGQWFNIDQWHRSASGKLKHRYLHTAPERDILSSPYNEDDKCISKTLLKELVFKIQDQISFFQQTIPHWINNWSPETSVRIIICEL